MYIYIYAPNSRPLLTSWEGVSKAADAGEKRLENASALHSTGCLAQGGTRQVGKMEFVVWSELYMRQGLSSAWMDVTQATRDRTQDSRLEGGGVVLQVH